MVVTQYPHTLTGTITGNAVKDEATGDWAEGTKTSFSLKCRAESSSISNEPVKQVDGLVLDYSWTVYMPKSTIEIQVGTTVTVSRGDKLFIKDTVKRYELNQLNAKVLL